MLHSGVRFDALDEPVSRDRSRSAAAMAELFLPLDRLLVSGGDPRLKIDPVSRVNVYGCQPLPCPGTLSFASSTATSISQPAYDRARKARAELLVSTLSVGDQPA